MKLQTFHSGSTECDPLELVESRESAHCERIGVPFLSVPISTLRSGSRRIVWAYLLPRENVSAKFIESTGDYTAQYFAMLVLVDTHRGVISKKVVPYHDHFKQWATRLRYASLHWTKFPDEEFALA